MCEASRGAQKATTLAGSKCCIILAYCRVKAIAISEMEDHCHSFFDRLIRPMVGAHALFSLLLKIFLRFVAASVLGVRVDGPNNTQVIQMWWWARKQWLSNRKTVNIVHHDIFFARCRMY